MTASDPSAFGKYRLVAELGHGGMADVFLAVQQGPAGFSKLVVLKRLRPNLADDPDFIAMLMDEARIAARLNHPNVVQTNEIGNVGNHYYIAMEYLDGQPLHRVTHRANARGGMPRNDAYVVLMDVLAGLRHAHTLLDFDGSPLDIVHRDVTPHNVFVTYDGQIKIVDFGIAKAVGRASVETQQGVVKGKVHYMSPEQATGMNVDARSDVFAVGIMLWEAAAGQRMWKGLEDMQVLRQLILGDVPTSPRAVNPDVPAEIDRICQRALAPLETRYGSADEMRADIDAYLKSTGERPDARGIGGRVSELFADKRAEVKETIETKLAELKNLPTSPFVVAVIPESASDLEFTEETRDLTSMTGVTNITGSPGFSMKVVISAALALGMVVAATFVVVQVVIRPPAAPVSTASTAVGGHGPVEAQDLPREPDLPRERPALPEAAPRDAGTTSTAPPWRPTYGGPATKPPVPPALPPAAKDGGLDLNIRH